MAKNKTDVVTRIMLQQELRQLKSELKAEIGEEMKQYKDEILTKMDEVVGKLDAIREDNEIGSYQTRELREQVDNHEKRLTKLEKPSQ